MWHRIRRSGEKKTMEQTAAAVTATASNVRKTRRRRNLLPEFFQRIYQSVFIHHFIGIPFSWKKAGVLSFQKAFIQQEDYAPVVHGADHTAPCLKYFVDSWVKV